MRDAAFSTVKMFSTGNNDGAMVGTETSPSLRRTPSVRTRSAPAIPRTRQRSSDVKYSSSDSEDERQIEKELRGRSLDKDTEHKLHEAVSSIKVTRSMSPEEARKKMTDEVPVKKISPVSSLAVSLAPNTHIHLAKSASSHNLGSLPLMFHASKETSCAIESDQDDRTGHVRPTRMARKKSGELVRSSLKSGGRRPASMPSTPICTKNVHFDRKLEHIRHFLHSEKPAAVSAQPSPTEDYASQSEFPWESNIDSDDELSIELPNFVPEAQQTANEGAIIKVETVYLSSDRRSLIGRVAVRNLAFEKYVCVRYTLDYWTTTSETAASYTEDVRKKQRDDAFDRFLFNIKIDDFTGVTNKTMFFCVKYNTGGQDYWDSNGGQNFRVEFRKRRGTERRYSDPPVMASLQKTINSDLSPVAAVRDPAAGLMSPRSLIFENIYDNPPSNAFDDLEQDKPVKTKARSTYGSGAGGDKFSDRYDFGVSLSAAIAAANSSIHSSDDHVTLKHGRSASQQDASDSYNPYFTMKPSQLLQPFASAVSPVPKFVSQRIETPSGSGNVSPVPGITTGPQSDQGHAYQTLLDNYCFVRASLRRSMGYC